MIVGKAIYYLLTNATGVTDIVSTRVYPEVAQQDAALPYIVYNVTNNEPTDTKPEPSKLDTAQVEVNIYSDSYTEAIDLAVAVRAALDRVKGTYNGVNVQSIQYLNEIIDFDEPQRAYNINADYDVRISRSGFEIAQGSPITGVELGELSDVNVAGVADGNALVYDEASGDWIPGTAGSALIAGAEIDITEVNGFSIISVEPDLAVTSLTTTGQGTIGGNFIIGGELRMTGATPRLIRPYDIGGAAGELIIQSNGNLIVELDENSDEDNKAFIVKNGADVEVFRVDESGVVTVNQAFALPTADGTANQLLKTDGSGTLTFGANLKDLEDVQLNTPSSGALLQYNGTYWAAAALSIPSVPSTYYHNRYATEAETLRSGATATVELYYTAQADGDGYAESASSDTATTGFDIRRKLYYSEAAQADCDTGTWVQFADIADDTTFASAKATLLAYLKERTGGTVPISLKMTWEEVAEAPSFTGLLNESYGSGAAAAYSVRRLNGNYTGAAIQVERSSDNTYQDIGFDSNGDLDESALTAFCTGTVCKVRTWYGQEASGGTGSGNDAVQTDHTKQPTIYTGGAIVKENGMPAVEFDGSDDGLTLSSLTYGNGLSLISLYNQTSGTRGRIWCDDITGQQGYWILFGEDSVNGDKFQVNDGTGFDTFTHQNAPINQQNLLNIFFSSSQIVDSVNGTAQTQSVTGFSPPINLSGSSAGFAIGNSGNMTYATAMRGQEFILYNSDKSTDRTSIESNIGDYFTQNTPLLDTYTGAAAAYSLRKLRTAYTGSAIRVRRASDNTEQDIGFNVFGELDTVSLASFCSGTDGFVKTWYDQSGNANDATQTTTANQPKIYDSSTGVVTENGKPAVYSSGGKNLNTGLITLGTSGDISVDFFAVVNNSSTNEGVLFALSDNTSATDRRRILSYKNDSSTQKSVRLFGGYTVVDSTATGQVLFNTNYGGGGGAFDVRFDGSSATLDSFSNTGLNVQSSSGFALFGPASAVIPEITATSSDSIGYIQEAVFYLSDQSANRTNIESNIATFYGITL